MSTPHAPAPLPWIGRCRCERVQMRVSQPPLLSAACHCAGCQRMSSSAFSLTLLVPKTGFAIVEGEAEICGRHGADIEHRGCAHCMTWMFTRPQGVPFVNVRPTLLDDASWFVPYMETYTSARLPWASTPAERSFEAFPPPEAYGELLGAFAEWAKARGWPAPVS